MRNRGSIRSESQPVKGPMTAVVMPEGTRRMALWKMEYPRMRCRKMGRRSVMAVVAAGTMKPSALPAAKAAYR